MRSAHRPGLNPRVRREARTLGGTVEGLAGKRADKAGGGDVVGSLVGHDRGESFEPKVACSGGDVQTDLELLNVVGRLAEHEIRRELKWWQGIVVENPGLSALVDGRINMAVPLRASRSSMTASLVQIWGIMHLTYHPHSGHNGVASTANAGEAGAPDTDTVITLAMISAGADVLWRAPFLDCSPNQAWDLAREVILSAVRESSKRNRPIGLPTPAPACSDF